MVYKGHNKTFDFIKFKTIRTFGDDIGTNSINTYTGNEEQKHLAKYVKEFKSKTKLPYSAIVQWRCNSTRSRKDV